jgi:hypothetical protein
MLKLITSIKRATKVAESSTGNEFNFNDRLLTINLIVVQARKNVRISRAHRAPTQNAAAGKNRIAPEADSAVWSFCNGCNQRAAEGGTRHCNAVLRRVQPKNQLNLGAQSER